jgi:predicted ArsR family transcriptional regulator
MESKADLILHPIRMQVIQALMTAGRLTPQQIAERLQTVPQATLYRHLNKLAAAGLITVAAERPNRGTVEKVYALAEAANPALLDGEKATPAEHQRYFLSFIAKLLGDFGQYIGQEQARPMQDGLTYRQAHLQLSDQEYAAFVTKLAAVITEVLPNEPAPGRRLRILSTLIIPEPIRQKE